MEICARKSRQAAEKCILGLVVAGYKIAFKTDSTLCIKLKSVLEYQARQMLPKIKLLNLFFKPVFAQV